MNITEKTAYLKGLLEGMSIDESKPESKLLKAIVETLDDLANEVADLGDVCEYLEDYIDEVDHDLGDLEAECYDCDCDCDCDCDDDCCDCDDEVYEIECPVCNDIIYLDGEMLEQEGMVCPNCGTELEFDFDGCDYCECECEEAETEE